MARQQTETGSSRGDEKLQGAVHDVQYFGKASVECGLDELSGQIQALHPDHSDQGRHRKTEKPLVNHMSLVVSVFGLTGLSMVKKGVLRRKKGTVVFNLAIQCLTRCKRQGSFLVLVSTEQTPAGEPTNKHTIFFFRSASDDAAALLASNIATAYGTVFRGITAYASLVGALQPEPLKTGTPKARRKNPSSSGARPLSMSVPDSPMVIRAKRVSLQEGLKFDVLNVQDEMLQELQEGQRAQSIQFDEHCFRGSQLTIDEIQQEQGDGPSAAKAAEMEAFYPKLLKYARSSTSAAQGPSNDTDARATHIAAGLSRQASQQYLEQLGQYVVHSAAAQQ